MKIKSVVIHPYVYTVDHTDKKPKDCYGQIDFDDQIIEVSRHYNFRMEQDTLLHECIHGLCHQINQFKSDDEEEDFVLKFTPRLLAFIKDNVDLIQFLQMTHPEPKARVKKK